MRVVLDTNVLISACLKPGGLEARVLRQAQDGQFQIAVSEIVLAEYREVAARQKFAAQAACFAQQISWIAANAIHTAPEETAHAASDDDDNRLLECAQAAQAEYLITGNKRHFPAFYEKTQIVNAREFIDATFACRPGCGACCIAPSISSPIPGMPEGKPAGVRCIQLTADNHCQLFNHPDRPGVCVSLRPHEAMCGFTNEEAFANLTQLEQLTRPGAVGTTHTSNHPDPELPHSSPLVPSP